jgi:hypothetical protein
MKKLIELLSDDQLRATHPIASSVPGWFFRVTETSMGAYTVEGRDRYGRVVSHQGSDPDAVLVQAMRFAEQTSSGHFGQRNSPAPDSGRLIGCVLPLQKTWCGTFSRRELSCQAFTIDSRFYHEYPKLLIQIELLCNASSTISARSRFRS